MSLRQAKEKFPEAKEVTNKNNTVLKWKDTIYNLPDEWAIRFKNKKADWIHFHHYIKDFDIDKFNACLIATKSVMKDFEQEFGKPDEIEVGDTVYKDPYVKRHWGYDVIEARWNNTEGMKIKVEFQFFGGKGEYFLLFKIDFFDYNNPYFD